MKQRAKLFDRLSYIHVKIVAWNHTTQTLFLFLPTVRKACRLLPNLDEILRTQHNIEKPDFLELFESSGINTEDDS